MSLDLLELFNAQNGVVCCVGAGGKKTTMFKLADLHPCRVGITATSHIEFFPKSLQATKYIATENDLLELIAKNKESQAIAFAQPSERPGRRAGISPDSILKFKAAGNFDLMVIKSDGARSRYIKAPAEHEPPIPVCADTVIPVVSAKVIGLALTDDIAHRVDLLSKITGLNKNDTIRPEHIARLLSSDEGSLRNSGMAKVIPLINMVDDSELEKTAREAVKQALQMTDRFNSVILAAMNKDQPIVDIISE